MTTETTTAAITFLRTVAKVPVFVGERLEVSGDSILISELKMGVIAGIYEKIYSFTHRAWRNMPPAPGCDPPYVIMWMLACEDYEVNHNTISWTGARPNTFVHIWSMIERLSGMFMETGVEWVVGPREAAGYCTATNVVGPADTHIYSRELHTPPQVVAMAMSMRTSTSMPVNREFLSFFDMEVSAMMPGSGWRTRG